MPPLIVAEYDDCVFGSGSVMLLLSPPQAARTTAPASAAKRMTLRM